MQVRMKDAPAIREPLQACLLVVVATAGGRMGSREHVERVGQLLFDNLCALHRTLPPAYVQRVPCSSKKKWGATHWHT